MGLSNNRMKLFFLMVSFLIFHSGILGSVFADPTATLTSSPTVNLKTGESTTVTFSVHNDKGYCGVTAYYSLDSTSYSNKIDRIGAQQSSQQVNIEVSAPPIGSGSGSAQHTIYVKIVTDKSLFCNGEIYSPTLTLNLNYDDSEFQNAKSNANTAINSAKNAISAASSSIANAQNAITAAKNIGADVSSAEVKLTSAQTAYQNAQSNLTSAQNSFNQNTIQGFNLATSYADDATNYANTAKADADIAIPLANTAKEKKEAQLKLEAELATDAHTALTNAKNAIDSANSAITSARSAILNAKNIGADTSSAQTLLDTANSKLTIAESKYNDAVSQFDSSKWDTAKQYAAQAESYAIDAQTNAKNAESAAIQAKEKYEKELREAQLKLEAELREAQLKLEAELTQARSKLSEAQTAYNNVVEQVDFTNKIIARVSEMKIDISGFSKELEKVTSTLIDAKAEVDKAKTRFDNKEYADSKKSSSASLEITGKHTTILQNIQYNAALAAKEVVTKRHPSVASSYNSALKSLEDSKAKMTGDIYSSRKENLDKAKADLDKCLNLINNGDSYLNAKNYHDATNSYRSAYSQLDSAESLSTSIQTSITTEQAGVIQKIIDFIKGILKSIFG